MDKITINNQVVLMRKYVKQAKVHMINKLTKQVKLLQNRKGDEKQVAKSKRKAERFLQEINILKKTKPDYVSKLALSKTRDWKSILEQKNSPLEDRCLAMLATYETVQREVENFCNSNSNLIPKIPEFIKEWELKNKFTKNLSKGPRNVNIKNIKQQRNNDKGILSTRKSDSCKNASKVQFGKNSSFCDITIESSSADEDGQQEIEKEIKSKPDVEKVVNLDEVLNKNYSSENDLSAIEKSVSDVAQNNVMNDESSSDSDDNGLESPRIDTLTNIPQTKILMDENFDNQKPEESSTDSEDEIKSINSGDKLSRQVSIESLSNTKNSQITIDPIQFYDNSIKHSLKTVTVLNLDDLQGLEEIPVNKLLKNEEEVCEGYSEEVTPSLEEESDTFFLRGTETNSAQTREFEFSKAHPDNLPFMSIDSKYLRKDIKWSSYQKPMVKRELKKPFNSFNSIKSNNDRSYSSESKNRYHPERKRFKKDEFYPKNVRKFQREPEGEKSFQSYKRDSFDKYSFKLKYEKAANFSQQDTNKKDNVNEKPLHPSWEAKKRQKELIKTQFQGKRIVFND